MKPMRRRMLQAGLAAAAHVVVRPAVAQETGELAAAVARFADGRAVQAGRVKLDIASLVDNGNVVPMRVVVAREMSAADHERAAALGVTTHAGQRLRDGISFHCIRRHGLRHRRAERAGQQQRGGAYDCRHGGQARLRL